SANQSQRSSPRPLSDASSSYAPRLDQAAAFHSRSFPASLQNAGCCSPAPASSISRDVRGSAQNPPPSSACDLVPEKKPPAHTIRLETHLQRRRSSRTPG